MSVGDCKTFPCATPLDFEQTLVSLFAVDSYGCIGIKIAANTDACAGLESAIECASDMPLWEVIQGAIVDDGYGGNALNVSVESGAVTCTQDCAEYKDFESLLKSLFAKRDDGCFALRTFQLAGCETFGEDYQECSAELTVEQVVRTSLWTDSCGNQVLGTWIPTWIQCGDDPCGVAYTFDWLVKNLFLKYSGSQCGGVNLNWSALDASSLTSLQDCGKFYSFEDAFRASLNWNDCGLTLNVFMVDISRGEIQ